MTAGREQFAAADLPIFDELADLGRSPDLTARVMGRLGYMHVRPQACAKRRRRQILWRCGVLSMLLGTVVGATAIYQSSRSTITPVTPSFSEALDRDLSRQYNEFNSVFQSIRNRVIIPPAPPLESFSEPGRDAAHDRPAGDETGDDIERSAGGPGRWV